MAFKFNFNELTQYNNAAIVIVFIFGMIYYANSYNLHEPMENADSKNKKEKKNTKDSKNIEKRCSNMLIEKDGAIYLYNSKIASVPGVNPLKFENLEEYAEFYEWQKSQNIECPLLFLQYTTDTQNNELIQVKPSIFENSGGLPKEKNQAIPGQEGEEYYEENKILDATKNSTPNSNFKFNSGMYSGFDQHNQNVGLDTPLDKMFSEKNSKSANPMDRHWGGKKHTQAKVKAGDYKEREVHKYTS